jgi:hypothetical protein
MTEQKKEGELKRQTRMIVPKIKKLYGYPPVQHFIQREVEKVLDEAKTDFPDPDEIRFKIVDPDEWPMDDPLLMTDWKTYGLAAAEWFKKWFIGDAK